MWLSLKEPRKSASAVTHHRVWSDHAGFALINGMTGQVHDLAGNGWHASSRLLGIDGLLVRLNLRRRGSIVIVFALTSSLCARTLRNGTSRWIPSSLAGKGEKRSCELMSSKAKSDIIPMVVATFQKNSSGIRLSRELGTGE